MKKAWKRLTPKLDVFAALMLFLACMMLADGMAELPRPLPGITLKELQRFDAKRIWLKRWKDFNEHVAFAALEVCFCQSHLLSESFHLYSGMPWFAAQPFQFQGSRDVKLMASEAFSMLSMLCLFFEMVFESRSIWIFKHPALKSKRHARHENLKLVVPCTGCLFVRFHKASQKSL